MLHNSVALRSTPALIHPPGELPDGYHGNGTLRPGPTARLYMNQRKHEWLITNMAKL
jgi:hypothetical protein